MGADKLNTGTVSGIYRIVKPEEYEHSLIRVTDSKTQPEKLSPDSDLLIDTDTATLLIGAHIRRVSFEVLSGPGIVAPESILFPVLPRHDLVLRMRGIHESLCEENVPVLLEPKSIYNLNEQFESMHTFQRSLIAAFMLGESQDVSSTFTGLRAGQLGVFPSIVMPGEDGDG